MISLSLKGTTRRVLVIGPWALKFARGPVGRRCNCYEAELFRTVDDRRRAMLCPVRWCAKSGWLLMMAAATPLTEAEKDNLIDTDGFPDWDYMPGEDSEPFEYKATDWGWFEGRLVAVDYSTPAFDTDDPEVRSDPMLKITRIALPKVPKKLPPPKRVGPKYACKIAPRRD
jgi:hypothetical protein